MTRQRISACVMTYNEERDIRRCLESLTWCDEIVVLDSFSTDKTIDICKEFTDQVHTREWEGYVGTRNIIRSLAKHEWVLFLDADEEVSEELREEIVQELSRENSGYVGYEFPRQVYYLNKWIKHGEWYPDIKLRLFKKSHGYSGGQEPHDQVIVDGSIKRLRGHIYHYTYEDIYEHLETMNRYSTITARAKFNDGKRFCWTHILFRPAWRFFKAMFVKAGVLDGRRGFLIASVSAFGVAMKYLKLWELQLNQQRQTKAQDGSTP